MLRWFLFLFSDFKWARKLVGGRWEKWYVDHPVCIEVWHHESDGLSCSIMGMEINKPTPLCMGIPLVEIYENKK